MLAILLSLLFAVQAGTPSRLEGAVAGRILVRDGKPEAKIRVMAFDAEEGTGNSIVSLAETDDAGFYRLENVRPGRYVIAAGFVDQPSYYPGVAERARARVVSVVAGTALENIDF